MKKVCEGYITLFYNCEKKERQHFKSPKERIEIIKHWKNLYGINHKYFHFHINYTELNPNNEEQELIEKIPMLENADV